MSVTNRNIEAIQTKKYKGICETTFKKRYANQ